MLTQMKISLIYWDLQDTSFKIFSKKLMFIHNIQLSLVNGTSFTFFERHQNYHVTKVSMLLQQCLINMCYYYHGLGLG